MKTAPISLTLAILLAASTCSINASAFAAPKDKDVVPKAATPREIQMGDKAEKELEKSPNIKLLDLKDPKAKALSDKVNAMVRELGKNSTRPNIKYQVKIVEGDDLNAFTLPNGKIFLFRGLIDFAGSDDEIAAVLSHEIGHNARMHALRGQAKASKLSWVGLAAMAAMLTGSKSGADVGQFSQYLLMGIMNGYTEEYEKEADEQAILQMEKTQWNPSALVTFMNRLNQEEKRRPEWEPGIFRTHPPTAERAEAAIEELKREKIPYTPRDVQGAKEAHTNVPDEKDRVQLLFGKTVLLELGANEKTLPQVLARADGVAAQINTLMKANLLMHEITVAGDEQRAQINARGLTIIELTAADSAPEKQTPLQMATTARDKFRRIFWRETLDGGM